MSDRSLTALLSFLDYVSDKGLMAKNTAAGRKAACSKVLGILDPEEQTDVSALNTEDVMTRFINLEGKGYTPKSLTVYKSRMSSSIEEFLNYTQNPSAYKPSVSKKRSAKQADANRPKSNMKAYKPIEVKVFEGASRSEAGSSPAANVFPIPIRADVVVRIHNLPFDLSSAEAEKISAVVKAMALN